MPEARPNQTYITSDGKRVPVVMAVTAVANTFPLAGMYPLLTVPPLRPGELTAAQYDLLRYCQIETIRYTAGWTFEGDRILGHAPTPVQAETEADRELRAARVEQRRIQDEEENRLSRIAHAKAEATLRRMLTPEQLASFDEDGYFTLTGSEGNLYQIYDGSYSGNIDWIDAGSPKANFCCHPSMTGTNLQGERERLPLADALIAQKLMLETDELGFLRTTVKNRGEWPPAADVHATRLPHGQRCRCKSCRCGEDWAW